MKQIGIMRMAGDEWHIATHNVEIPNTNPIFTVEPDSMPPNPLQWHHIGWIYPGDGAGGGGKIYQEKQGSNSVAAYVKRETPPQPELLQEMREVIAGMSGRIGLLEDLARKHSSVIDLVRGHRLPPTSDAMTFYDYAFIAACMAVGTDESTSKQESDTLMKAAHKIAALITAARHPA